MAKCDICRVYNPESECLAESCIFVKYGIAHKVNSDAAFSAKFGELNDILSIQSIELLMEIMVLQRSSNAWAQRQIQEEELRWALMEAQ